MKTYLSPLPKSRHKKTGPQDWGRLSILAHTRKSYPIFHDALDGLFPTRCFGQSSERPVQNGAAKAVKILAPKARNEGLLFKCVNYPCLNKLPS